MSDNDRVTTQDLTDAQIERVINSQGFQKMLAYNRLADGIEVLEEQDQLFQSMVTSITKQHGTVGTESSVREVLDLFREEVQTFTEPLADDGGMDDGDLEDLYVDDGGRP